MPFRRALNTHHDCLLKPWAYPAFLHKSAEVLRGYEAGVPKLPWGVKFPSTHSLPVPQRQVGNGLSSCTKGITYTNYITKKSRDPEVDVNSDTPRWPE